MPEDRPVAAGTTDGAFGGLLRRLRHAAGLTLEELSTVSGVSVRAISNMERGESLRPQRGTVTALADALQLTGGSREELLGAARAGRRRSPTSAPGVMAMPRGVSDFTGRGREVSWLTSLADGSSGTQAPIAVISGPPGVGKTSLAVHAVSQLSPRYPDGRFFIDLRGLETRPQDPAVVLERLVRTLAPDRAKLPLDLGDRAALYRSVVAERRVAVVLDNAADETQVRPLLPASGPALTVITSRRLLTGLEGMARLTLQPLSDDEAHDLLERLVAGLPGTGGDARAVIRLAHSCGNLPLALRIVGNRLASRPDWSPDRLAARLEDEGRRLDALTAGDLEITAAFELSHGQLSGAAQQLFRRLSLVPGPDSGPELAAALGGLPADTAEDALDELVERGLVQSGFTTRYRLHDLIRLFARRRLEQEEPADERGALETRAVDWLLDTAIVAGRWFEPDYAGLPEDWDDRVPLDTAEAAQHWLMAEADSWLAALEWASAAGRWQQVIDVAESMHWFSDRWIHWGHWPRVFTLSSDAAAELADHAATATHLNYLSWARSVCCDDQAGAMDCAVRARAEALLAGDLRQQAWADSYLASAMLDAGNACDALGPAARAVRRFRAVGDREGLVMHALAVFGIALERSGRPQDALRCYQYRLALASDPATAPSPAVSGMTRVSAARDIGRLHIAQKRWREAVETLELAVSWESASAIPQWQAQLYVTLGQARCAVGQTARGLADLDRAVAIYRRIGDASTAQAMQAVRDGLDR